MNESWVVCHRPRGVLEAGEAEGREVEVPSSGEEVEEGDEEVISNSLGSVSPPHSTLSQEVRLLFFRPPNPRVCSQHMLLLHGL